MTFDNEAELYKIKEHFPGAELVLRIKVEDSRSIFKVMKQKKLLSSRFCFIFFKCMPS